MCACVRACVCMFMGVSVGGETLQSMITAGDKYCIPSYFFLPEMYKCSFDEKEFR